MSQEQELYPESSSNLPAKVQRPTFGATVANDDVKGMTVDEIAAYFEGAVEVDEFLDTWGDVLNGDEKLRLVGTPFLIISGTLNSGEMGEFVSLRVQTKDNARYIVNDGSTGILEQCRRIFAAGLEKPVICKRGLRVSEYEFTGADGVSRPAKTFYLG